MGSCSTHSIKIRFFAMFFSGVDKNKCFYKYIRDFEFLVAWYYYLCKSYWFQVFLLTPLKIKSRKMPMTILFYLSSIRIICLKTQNTELWRIISQIILSNNPFSWICSVFIVLMFDRKKQKLRREAQLLGKQLKLIWLETSLGAGIFEYLS